MFFSVSLAWPRRDFMALLSLSVRDSNMELHGPHGQCFILAARGPRGHAWPRDPKGAIIVDKWSQK